MSNKPTMTIVLTDGVILLRQYCSDDINSLYEAVRESINELTPWQDWCHANYSIEETRAFIKSLDEAKEVDYGFGVFDKETGVFLGGSGINQINRIYQMGNLGYWTRTSHAGRGVATAATRLLAKFGFEQLGLQRIEIVAAVGNLASQHVATKAGARREGVLRKRLLIHGEAHDAVMHSLVPEDLGIL